MTKEQAIERLKRIDIKYFLSAKIEQSNYIIDEADKTNEAIETVLAIIEKQDNEISQLKNMIKFQSKDIEKAVDYTFELNKEIELEDKIIDLMSEEISKNILNTCPLEDYNYDLDCENKCNDNYKECWKQYFENKAKEME